MNRVRIYPNYYLKFTSDEHLAAAKIYRLFIQSSYHKKLTKISSGRMRTVEAPPTAAILRFLGPLL